MSSRLAVSLLPTCSFVQVYFSTQGPEKFIQSENSTCHLSAFRDFSGVVLSVYNLLPKSFIWFSTSHNSKYLDTASPERLIPGVLRLNAIPIMFSLFQISFFRYHLGLCDSQSMSRQVLEGLVGWSEVIDSCSLAAFTKILKTCIGKVGSLYAAERSASA